MPVSHEFNDASSFWKTFNEEIIDIRSSIKHIDCDDSISTLEALKVQKQRISYLQKIATDTNSLLPAYDVRRSQEMIESVLKELKSIEILVFPRKKFTFSARTKAFAISNLTIMNDTSSYQLNNNETLKVNDSENQIAGLHVLKSLNGDILLLTKETFNKKLEEGFNPQLLVRDSSNLLMSVPTIVGSVRLENLSDCTILLGPCSTSVYLENCTNCVIYIFCHQLRIHKSNNCSLYVRVNSHPIIEDCTCMQFAPYNITYNGIEDDLKVK